MSLNPLNNKSVSIRKQIKLILENEINKRGICVYESLLNLLVEQVLSGCYAFRLIFNQNLILEKFYELDWKLVKLEPTRSDIYSIDAGKRYQWTYNEIILLEIDFIRDLKLNKLLV